MGTTTLAEARRRKYLSVLDAACSLREFSADQIWQGCRETTPQFVTRVLQQLVQDGYLQAVAGERPRFQWRRSSEAFSRESWTDRWVRGAQIPQLPADERPRERLLRWGAESLQTAELLAILIRSGRQGESALQAGQRLAARLCDRLASLCQLSPAELRDISPAVSQAAYCQIMAGIELGRRVAAATEESAAAGPLDNPQRAIAWCRDHFARLATDRCQEEFHVVTLNTRLNPIGQHQISVGTLDASLVHPREVFRPAIRDAASALLLVHNHPSGDPSPSMEDRKTTANLRRAAELVGIRIVDHIVLARRQAISLAEWEASGG